MLRTCCNKSSLLILSKRLILTKVDFHQCPSSSTAGGRQTLNELEGRMEQGIELGEEIEEEAHLSPAYKSELITKS